MKILLVSSEVHPFSKTGGLADMVGALAKALGRLGHEVALITPLYRCIEPKALRKAVAGPSFSMLLGSRTEAGRFRVLKWGRNVHLHFLEHPGFYDRSGIYQEKGRDYSDNDRRFIFFAQAAAQLAVEWKPDIVHGHDWQAGLVPLYLRQTLKERLPATVFSIHNLAYQGLFPSPTFELTGLPPDLLHPEGLEFYGQWSALKAGLVYSDMLATVSPRYAREIQTVEYGCGLEGLLRARQGSLRGILNGVDYDEWNTGNNPHLPKPFSTDQLTGKKACKAALQRELGLARKADIPLFASITRLADQKGADLVHQVLQSMSGFPLQFALLGSGSPELERAYRELASRQPGRIAARIGYDGALAHRIEAGADFFLMPSRYEPCGLNQMYSLRYGTIPVVRATGGLADSVIDATEDLEHADGIKFGPCTEASLGRAVEKALALYRTPDLLRRYRRNGMTRDFSWERTAKEYEALYHETLGES